MECRKKDRERHNKTKTEKGYDRTGMESFLQEDDSMLCYEKNRNTLTIRLIGELDHSMAAQIRAEVDELVSDSKVRRLIFDLIDLHFMDSSGIGLIIGRYKLMARRGGSVAVSGPGAHIDRIFEMAGLYQLVERLA